MMQAQKSDASSGDSHPLIRELRQRELIVCVGSGGVGKTTTSALVALQAARLGKRVLVMTVDPARRLATSLGLAEIASEPQRVDLGTIGVEGGEMWAMMLDMKRAFDDLVDRYAPDEETRDVILSNRFYDAFSSSLAGAQELSAS